jgi:hypothetical protein
MTKLKRNKKAKLNAGLIIRLLGAIIGAGGFLLLAYQQTLFGTVFVGMGSMIIAFGETI